MTEINRRSFVKSVLASTAGLTLVEIAPAESLANWSAQADAQFESIQSGEQLLRVSPAGQPLAFQNFVRSAENWKPSTLAGVPVITGPSFPLKSSRVSQTAGNFICQGNATAQGHD